MSFFRRHPLGSAASGVPPGTLGIIIACIVLWFVETATIRSGAPLWENLKLSAPGLLHFKLWQLLTYQFLHDVGGVGHVLFNMLSVLFFVPRLESRWGTAGMFRYFLTCGAGGGILYFLVAVLLKDPNPVVGASGAILGILMAWALIWPYEQVRLYFVIPIQVRYFVLIWGLVDLMIAWSSAFGGSATGAVAHLGGALTGWAYLAHAHRLRKIFRNAPSNPFGSIRRWWRRRHMRVADRDFDQWLKDQDDTTRH